MAKLFNITINTPDGLYLDEDIQIATFKTSQGYKGIMANATEFTAAIIPSELILKYGDNTEKIYYVGTGIIHFKDNYMSIIINEISLTPLQKIKFEENKEAKKYSIIEQFSIKRNLIK
ncbi:F0F1 ATP synthase subunit epsilon [Metamycoplasma hyosynoviae]|uniref:FoF1 ATP synthase subunit delta/epsilon n=1 Tax=Metamycoplasma hyosynoviae TaxID=29559 RepID=UPI002358B950|nr:F0F1 ATP synthase subunit epsilon [Metamycoplasma hyosynoviae]MDC8963307.1 F0F1 ATP synthase subunit epsilon [Metamycoplasma hyosynoviae]MDD7837883.1 F0F1 ATP synthase subunit epsilon [Metamycoplasma hyosynoviae]MDD7898332.1 F0F1 ATP synthase subunit epsilon [Metamycoplasma hyosynoviae]